MAGGRYLAIGNALIFHSKWRITLIYAYDKTKPVENWINFTWIKQREVVEQREGQLRRSGFRDCLFFFEAYFSKLERFSIE